MPSASGAYVLILILISFVGASGWLEVRTSLSKLMSAGAGDAQANGLCRDSYAQQVHVPQSCDTACK